jgi:integrase
MGLYRRQYERKKRKLKKKKGKEKDERIIWMSFTANGKQYRRSTGTTDKKAADLILSKIKVAIAEGKWLDIDASSNRTFDELMETYFMKIKDKPSTLDRKRDALPHLEEVFSGWSLDRISADAVDDYKLARLQQAAADSTILNEVRLLSHALNTVKWTRTNPVRDAKRIKLKAGQVDRWLTRQEEEKLLPKTKGKLNGELEDIVLLDLNTGMSQEEIIKLQWSKVFLFRKSLVTGREKTRKRRQSMKGRSNGSDDAGNLRTIPLNETAYAILKRRAASGDMSGYVFRDENGGMIKADKLKKAFRKAVKESGIDHFRFHDLRHTFATRLAQAGVPLHKIAKLLGHRSIATTERYAHLCTESARDSVKVLDALGAPGRAGPSMAGGLSHFYHNFGRIAGKPLGPLSSVG